MILSVVIPQKIFNIDNWLVVAGVLSYQGMIWLSVMIGLSIALVASFRRMNRRRMINVPGSKVRQLRPMTVLDSLGRVVWGVLLCIWIMGLILPTILTFLL